MSVIAQRGLYGFPSQASSPSAQAVTAVAVASAPHTAAAPAAAAGSHVPKPPHQSRPSPPCPGTVAAELAALSSPPRKCHVVVLFGAHGVGKGAVAEALCRKHGYAHVSFGDIKREITSRNPALGRDFAALGPAVFKGYQERVGHLLARGVKRLVVDGLDPQYWKGQGHATLGAVDVCLLLSCSNSSADVDELVRRVTARGRENPSFAESRVRKHFADSMRAWAIVSALPQRLRGTIAEVNGMQAREVVLQQVELALQPYLMEPLLPQEPLPFSSPSQRHETSARKRSRSPGPRSSSGSSRPSAATNSPTSDRYGHVGHGSSSSRARRLDCRDADRLSCDMARDEHAGFYGGRSSYNRSAGYDYPDPRQGGSRYEGRDCDNGAARYGHSRSGYGDGGGYHGTRTDGNERGRAFGGRERSGDRSGGSSSSHSVIYSDRFSWEEGRQ